MLACFSTSSLAGPVEDVNEAIRRRDQLLPAANSSIILVGRIVMALNRGVVRIAHLGNRPSRQDIACYQISCRRESNRPMPERPFKLIKLKKTPAGSAKTFPSEISTPQAAIGFINSLDPETRAKLHWRVAASVLNGLAAGQGSSDEAGSALRHALAQEGWLAGRLGERE